MGALVQRVRQAARRFGWVPASRTAVVLALAVGIGFGVPVLGLVRNAARHVDDAVDPLLRDAGRDTGWLPGGSVFRRTLAEMQAEAFGTLLGVLLALALLLVGIALVNLVTLILARAAARRPETALRATLGAGSWRLAGHLLREGAGPHVAGMALGLLVAAGAGTLLSRTWPGDAPPWGDSLADGWSLAAVAGVFVLVPLAARLAPLGVAWSRALQRFLTTGGRATAGRGEVFSRHALAVVQVAASLVLLTAAGLLLRGFGLFAGEAPPPGFDPRGTLTVQIDLPPSPRMSAGERQRLLEEMRTRMATLSGVVDTSVATPGAWMGLGATERVMALCRDCWEMTRVMKPATDGLARIVAVSPGFFRAAGAPLMRGREFGAGDGEGAERVAVISGVFAFRLFPRGNPMGRSIQVGGSRGAWYTVVGIVDDLRAPGLGNGSAPEPTLYVSTLQHHPAVVSAAVRVAGGDPMRLLPAVERTVREVAPAARLSHAMTMEAHLARFRAPVEWFALLFGVLAAGALLLAASGLHGVMAYNAARRTREIGIRMALGATRRDVARMVVGQSLRITRTAALVGLFGAFTLARVLQLLLHGVEPFDPLLFAGVVALLAGIAVAASVAPTRRAAAVDPQISLRAE